MKIETFAPDDASAIARAAFAFVRFGVWTNHLSDADYAVRVQSAFELAAHAGLPVLLTIRSTEPLSAAEMASASSIEAAGRRFGRIVRETIDKYAPQIIGIELWNEPDLNRYWPTGNVNGTFPLFMRGACAVLRAPNLAIPVFGFGFARAPIGDTVSARLLSALQPSAAQCVNVVSYHAYGMTSEQMRNVTSEIRSRYGLPTAITEWGVPTRGSVVTSAAMQAMKVATFLESVDSLGVSLASIYEWKETRTAQSERERSFGLTEPSGVPKPALAVVQSYLKNHAASR
ncbi:cellulase family glycosylhydrolase [Caballeronia arvi]|uniref:cellulase family glycosylhydrolase n=1 Tax=Caballeronia arvi TaxID=1777135 RepID=UPI0007726129|nr:cellulase family glycosylhydrolase [Caballeronia arvi]